MNIKLIIALLATLATGVAATAELVLPPPYIQVLITAENAPTKLVVGNSYAVHIRQLPSGMHVAAIVDAAGTTLYTDLPTYTEGCTDPGTVWPMQAFGSIQTTPNAAGAVLDITSRALGTCHLYSRVPVDAGKPRG